MSADAKIALAQALNRAVMQALEDNVPPADIYDCCGALIGYMAAHAQPSEAVAQQSVNFAIACIVATFAEIRAAEHAQAQADSIGEVVGNA